MRNPQRFLDRWSPHVSIFCLLTGAVALVWGWSPAASLDLLDSWERSPYDDRQDPAGRSRIALLPGKELGFEISLSPGIQWPYAGIAFNPAHGPTDLGRYDHIVLEWRSRKGNPLQLVFMHDEPGITRLDRPTTRKVIKRELVPGTDWTRLDLPLDEFQTPIWWFKDNGLLPESGSPRRDRILCLCLAAGEAARQDLVDTVEVRSLELRTGPAHPVSSAAVAFFAIVLGLSPLARRKRVPIEPAPGIPQGNPALIPPPRRDQLWAFLQENYRRAELDLPKVAKETGLGEYRIGEILRPEGLTFRTVLNGMRLAESRRLLSESELQISEIAWTCGFGNVSHFNRLFKAKFGTTPSEARSDLRKSSECSATAGTDGNASIPPPEANPTERD